MAQITINIPDNQLNRIVNAICQEYNYQEKDVEGNPNPESKIQFARRMVKEWVLRTVKQAEIRAAREQAEREAIRRVDEEVNISA